MCLALALSGAALAAAQRVEVRVNDDDFYGSRSAGGEDPGRTYRVEMDEASGGVNFQTATAASDFRTTKLVAKVKNNGLARADAYIDDAIRFDAPGAGGSWGVAYAWVRAHAVTEVHPIDRSRYDYESSSGQSTALLNLSIGENGFSWRQDTNAYEYWSEEDDAPHGETWNDTRTEMVQRLPDGSVGSWKPTASGDAFRLPFYFRFGTNLDFHVHALARANLYGGYDQGGRSLADFGNTYQWRGIDAVYALNADGSHTRLSDYTLTSRSGVDYAAPVPEPASMLGLGVGAAAILRRRKRA